MSNIFDSNEAFHFNLSLTEKTRLRSQVDGFKAALMNEISDMIIAGAPINYERLEAFMIDYAKVIMQKFGIIKVDPSYGYRIGNVMLHVTFPGDITYTIQMSLTD